MRIAILAYPGCVASGVGGFADVLAVANHLRGRQLFETRVLSLDGLPVRAFHGPALPVDGRAGDRDADGAPWDAVYLPPAFGLEEPGEEATAWLSRAHAAGAVGCAACAGVFFLAAAGLLEDRVATTHWGLVEDFTRRFPGVRLEPERMLVDGGDYVCAGGLTAYFDLALHLTARFASAELAADCARTMLLDPGRTRQTPYMRLTGPPNATDPTIAEAEEWLARHHKRKVGLAELAAAVRLGERTLLRRFRKATGRTPGAYLQALRVEHAKRLLESSDLSMEEIAASTGHGDVPALHRAFKPLTGLTPGEYRRRFGIRTTLQRDMHEGFTPSGQAD